MSQSRQHRDGVLSRRLMRGSPEDPLRLPRSEGCRLRWPLPRGDCPEGLPSDVIAATTKTFTWDIVCKLNFCGERGTPFTEASSLKVSCTAVEWKVIPEGERPVKDYLVALGAGGEEAGGDMEAGATARKSPSPSREIAGAPELPTDVPSADTVHRPVGRPVCHLGATSLCGDGTCHFLQVSPRRTPEWVTLDQGAQEKQPAACRYGCPGCWGPGPALSAPCGRSRAPHQAWPSVRGDAGVGCLRRSHCWTEWGLHTDAPPTLTPQGRAPGVCSRRAGGPRHARPLTHCRGLNRGNFS